MPVLYEFNCGLVEICDSVTLLISVLHFSRHRYYCSLRIVNDTPDTSDTIRFTTKEMKCAKPNIDACSLRIQLWSCRNVW